MNGLCVLGVVTRAKRLLPQKGIRKDAPYVFKRENAVVTPTVGNEAVIRELRLKPSHDDPLKKQFQRRDTNVTDGIKYIYSVKNYWFECLVSGTTVAV